MILQASQLNSNVKFTCKLKAVRRRRAALGLSGATTCYAWLFFTQLPETQYAAHATVLPCFVQPISHKRLA